MRGDVAVRRQVAGRCRTGTAIDASGAIAGVAAAVGRCASAIVALPRCRSPAVLPVTNQPAHRSSNGVRWSGVALARNGERARRPSPSRRCARAGPGTLSVAYDTWQVRQLRSRMKRGGAACALLEHVERDALRRILRRDLDEAAARPGHRHRVVEEDRPRIPRADDRRLQAGLREHRQLRVHVDVAARAAARAGSPSRVRTRASPAPASSARSSRATAIVGRAHVVGDGRVRRRRRRTRFRSVRARPRATRAQSQPRPRGPRPGQSRQESDEAWPFAPDTFQGGVAAGQLQPRHDVGGRLHQPAAPPRLVPRLGPGARHRLEARVVAHAGRGGEEVARQRRRARGRTIPAGRTRPRGCRGAPAPRARRRARASIPRDAGRPARPARARGRR